MHAELLAELGDILLGGSVFGSRHVLHDLLVRFARLLVRLLVVAFVRRRGGVVRLRLRLEVFIRLRLRLKVFVRLRLRLRLEVLIRLRFRLEVFVRLRLWSVVQPARRCGTRNLAVEEALGCLFDIPVARDEHLCDQATVFESELTEHLDLRHVLLGECVHGISGPIAELGSR